MRIFRRSLLLLTSVCLGLLAKADPGDDIEKKASEGPVHGYCKDAVTKKPETGSTVPVSSGRLQNIKEIFSDNCGFFQFSKLPPGEVTLMFERKGHIAPKRGVAAGQSAIDVSSQVQRVEEPGGNESWHPLLKLFD